MFSRKKNRTVSIEMNDFYIRALICDGGDVANANIYEYPLPSGIVEDEIVIDEMVFFDLLKELVKEWSVSHNELRFFVPDHSVMMRTFEHPKSIETKGLKAYVEMELGRTIHLPFENPLIDVYDHDADDGEAVIFAAPSEEVMKLIGLYQDARLHPSILDVRTLSNLRFLEDTSYFSPGVTYLVADWSVKAVSISIYSNGNMDFHRYQPIEMPPNYWSYETDASNHNVYSSKGDIQEYHIPLTDQTFEMGRILNFYRFSLHKGEKSVDQIVLIGDNPEMDFIVEQLRSSIDTPIEVIDDAYVKKFYTQFNAKHLALIGLSLKGES